MYIREIKCRKCRNNEPKEWRLFWSQHFHWWKLAVQNINYNGYFKEWRTLVAILNSSSKTDGMLLPAILKLKDCPLKFEFESEPPYMTQVVHSRHQTQNTSLVTMMLWFSLYLCLCVLIFSTPLNTHDCFVDIFRPFSRSEFIAIQRSFCPWIFNLSWEEFHKNRGRLFVCWQDVFH